MTCWGWNEYGQTVGPGAFTAVSVGGLHSCGLRTDGTIACWGQDEEGESWRAHRQYALTDPPSGTFSAVSAGRAHSCGLRTDRSITCWGNNGDGQTDAPPGTFTSVSAGIGHSCGLRTDGSVMCWGDNRDGQTDAPPGTFTSVSAAWQHSCGLRTDQTITCWGHDGGGRLDVPSGSLSAVAASGNEHFCGLRTDGAIVCWGARWWDGMLPQAPSGTFTAVSTNTGLSCGLRIRRFGDSAGTPSTTGGRRRPRGRSPRFRSVHTTCVGCDPTGRSSAGVTASSSPPTRPVPEPVRCHPQAMPVFTSPR